MASGDDLHARKQAFEKLTLEFEKLAADGAMLPAWHDPTTHDVADLRAKAAACRRELQDLRDHQDELVPPTGTSTELTWIEALERKVVLYDTLTTDADGRCWTFEVPGCKPPIDRNLVHEFCSLAARAAVVGGFAEADASRPVQARAWLAQLKARRPDPPSDPDLITCVLAASRLLCGDLVTDAAMALAKSPFGRNVERLRKECGWTFEDLAMALELSKTAVLAHVHAGAKPRPSTLKEYADTFSAKLDRIVTIEDLER